MVMKYADNIVKVRNGNSTLIVMIHAISLRLYAFIHAPYWFIFKISVPTYMNLLVLSILHSLVFPLLWSSRAVLGSHISGASIGISCIHGIFKPNPPL